MEREEWQKGYVQHLACLSCGKPYSLKELHQHTGSIFHNAPPAELEDACSCGAPLDVQYDLDTVRKHLDPKLFQERFSEGKTFLFLPELLPFNEISAGKDIAFSRLVRAYKIEKDLYCETGRTLSVYLKVDADLPTGSFKDRPTVAAFNAALEAQGYTGTITSSTGNLGISTLHYAAAHNISALLLIPHTIGEKKREAMRINTTHDEEMLLQAQWKGERDQTIENYARLMLDGTRRLIIRFEGNYDQANRFASAVAARTNQISQEQTGHDIIFIPNDTFRVYYKEGSKTQGWETVAQLLFEQGVKEGTIKMITPIGSGALACSSSKGIQELQKLGLTSLELIAYAAQGEGCSPVVDALANGSDRIRPVKEPNTVAKSIAIGDPGSGYQLMDVIRNSHGAGIKVTEREIVEKTLRLFELEGILSQFVGGVSLAALYQGAQEGHFIDHDRVIVNITGHGKRILDDLENDATLFEENGDKLRQRAKAIVEQVESKSQLE